MEDLQIVVFSLDKEEYGVPINLVHEIIKTPETTKIPNVPPFIEGIINLRGQIIPIINLRRLLNMQLKTDDSEDENAVVVVLEIIGQQMGITVDQVSEVVKLPVDVIEQPPDILQCANNSIINGIGKIDQRLLILINLDSIVSREWSSEGLMEFQKEINQKALV